MELSKEIRRSFRRIALTVDSAVWGTSPFFLLIENTKQIRLVKRHLGNS
jgi:hypothetical protein